MHAVAQNEKASAHARLQTLLTRFAADTTGATVIEYGLIAALMAVVCITAFSALGGAAGGAWGTTANKVSAAMK